jgi:hypothetical protein
VNQSKNTNISVDEESGQPKKLKSKMSLKKPVDKEA